jgi:hypothetical protein
MDEKERAAEMVAELRYLGSCVNSADCSTYEPLCRNDMAILKAALRGHAAPLSEDSQHVRTAPDYFATLVTRARAAAAKAMVRYPQPNYVSLKIAEEAGEVVRGAVHYCEKRMEWAEVEGEIVQLLAMLIRFVTEGDQIIGAIPPPARMEIDHGQP